MKLVVLHLSDMHFGERNSYKQENIESIIHCLRKPCEKADNILIVVSGDLTFHGFPKECLQVEQFFSDLRAQIIKEFSFPSVNIFMVPGNHDVNNKFEVLTSDNLNKILKNHAFASKLPAERQKLKQAIKVCRRFGCFCGSPSLIDIRQLVFQTDDKQVNIQFNLINTAPFSAKEDEDEGFHYIPAEDLDKLKDSSKADYVFTIMHHPHHFFNWETKTRLEELLIRNSDTIFVGHEHYSKAIGMSTDIDNVQIYSGGMLCNAGNWDNSRFYIGELNSINRELSITEYKWDITEKMYLSEHVSTRVLGSSQGNSLGINVNLKEFDEIMLDGKYMISKSILDYFVFPLIEVQPKKQEEEGKEINKPEDFISDLDSKRKAFIFGQPGYGKTILAHYLFAHYMKSKAVILINGINIRDCKFEKIIKYRFEELYSGKVADWDRFNQISKDQRIIIIDDAHRIPEKLISNFQNFIDSKFGTIIQFAQSDIEFDIFERIKKREETIGYEYYRLLSFYKDRREKLISNIVKILVNQGEDAQQRVFSQIAEALNKQRNIFSWSPDGVVQFTKFACNNIGDSLRNDGDTFSKVFEMNLTNLITPHAGKIKVDKILFILDKIAYALHITPNGPSKYPMMAETIASVIRKYNSDYDEEIDPMEFIKIVFEAKILKKYEQGYIFTERSYLAYFIAREMKREAQKGNYTEFQKCLDLACFGINADIVLFITYISDNPLIISMIMDKAVEYISGWNEFTLAPVNIPYLTDVDGIKMLSPTEEDRKNAEKVAVEAERKEEQKRTLVDKSKVYSYEETELNIVEKMIRGVSVLTILSRALPSFEHIMQAPDKKRCVKLIYTLPLRIFHIWASEVEKDKDLIVAHIKQMLELKNLNEFEYRKNKLITIDDAARLLKAESVLLLLELLNTAMSNATRYDTIRYIDSFDYHSQMTYMLEHLMSQDKRDNPGDFQKEAVELYDKCRSLTDLILVQNVAKHYMVTSNKLDRGGRQRLISKLFNNNINQSKLLIAMNRNAKREGLV